MLKKTLLAGACFVALVSGAQAADSVELKVTGNLVNGSCTPSLLNNGVVDFGHIPLGNLSKTQTNQLGKKMTTLTITCDSAMPVAWQAVDNHSASTQVLTVTKAFANGGDCTRSDSHFGLGKTAGDVNIGSFCLAVDKDNVTVDGVKSDLVEQSYQEGMDTWHTIAGGDLTNGVNGQWRYMSAAEVSTLKPMAGKVFVYPLMVSAAIQGTDTLAITDNTNLDGSATLSLIYL
ncbi:DUF1120 domain-containing protein [Cronobacter dublinensis]|nr:DUF1120 domain-containing protein [Cronobacter dublinensis]EMD9247894.1 DUF1120 domain-containing protein [Cronobacter dublinensis]